MVSENQKSFIYMELMWDTKYVKAARIMSWFNTDLTETLQLIVSASYHWVFLIVIQLQDFVEFQLVLRKLVIDT